jgi:ankyrin repeat protein
LIFLKSPFCTAESCDQNIEQLFYFFQHNITPLHVAAKWGKANMVALLLDKGANLESKTR